MQVEITIFLKIIAVAVAVGFDVLAISIGVGIAQIPWQASVRLGISFATAEIVMQVIGFELGTGAGRLFGEIAEWIGLVLLALVGGFMIIESYRLGKKKSFDPTRGAGLLVASLSISLDSLGIGFALPAVGIPLIPLLITLSITTAIFTSIGLAFGAKIGERYERDAERVAGAMLILLAIIFSLHSIFGHAT
jgi:putative Mn2+ efflux pump MntP